MVDILGEEDERRDDLRSKARMERPRCISIEFKEGQRSTDGRFRVPSTFIRQIFPERTKFPIALKADIVVNDSRVASGLKVEIRACRNATKSGGWGNQFLTGQQRVLYRFQDVRLMELKFLGTGRLLMRMAAMGTWGEDVLGSVINGLGGKEQAQTPAMAMTEVQEEQIDVPLRTLSSVNPAAKGSSRDPHSSPVSSARAKEQDQHCDTSVAAVIANKHVSGSSTKVQYPSSRHLAQIRKLFAGRRGSVPMAPRSVIGKKIPLQHSVPKGRARSNAQDKQNINPGSDLGISTPTIKSSIVAQHLSLEPAADDEAQGRQIIAQVGAGGSPPQITNRSLAVHRSGSMPSAHTEKIETSNRISATGSVRSVQPSPANITPQNQSQNLTNTLQTATLDISAPRSSDISAIEIHQTELAHCTPDKSAKAARKGSSFKDVAKIKFRAALIKNLFTRAKPKPQASGNAQTSLKIGPNIRADCEASEGGFNLKGTVARVTPYAPSRSTQETAHYVKLVPRVQSGDPGPNGSISGVASLTPGMSLLGKDPMNNAPPERQSRDLYLSKESSISATIHPSINAENIGVPLDRVAAKTQGTCNLATFPRTKAELRAKYLANHRELDADQPVLSSSGALVDCGPTRSGTQMKAPGLRSGPNLAEAGTNLEQGGQNLNAGKHPTELDSCKMQNGLHQVHGLQSLIASTRLASLDSSQAKNLLRAQEFHTGSNVSTAQEPVENGMPLSQGYGRSLGASMGDSICPPQPTLNTSIAVAQGSGKGLGPSMGSAPCLTQPAPSAHGAAVRGAEESVGVNVISDTYLSQPTSKTHISSREGPGKDLSKDVRMSIGNTAYPYHPTVNTHSAVGVGHSQRLSGSIDVNMFHAQLSMCIPTVPTQGFDKSVGANVHRNSPPPVECMPAAVAENHGEILSSIPQREAVGVTEITSCLMDGATIVQEHVEVSERHDPQPVTAGIKWLAASSHGSPSTSEKHAVKLERRIAPTVPEGATTSGENVQVSKGACPQPLTGVRKCNSSHAFKAERQVCGIDENKRVSSAGSALDHFWECVMPLLESDPLVTEGEKNSAQNFSQTPRKTAQADRIALGCCAKGTCTTMKHAEAVTESNPEPPPAGPKRLASSNDGSPQILKRLTKNRATDLSNCRLEAAAAERELPKHHKASMASELQHTSDKQALGTNGNPKLLVCLIGGAATVLEHAQAPSIAQPLTAGPKWFVDPSQATPHTPEKYTLGVNRDSEPLVSINAGAATVLEQAQPAKPSITQPLTAGPKWFVDPSQTSPHAPDKHTLGINTDSELLVPLNEDAATVLERAQAAKLSVDEALTSGSKWLAAQSQGFTNTQEKQTVLVERSFESLVRLNEGSVLEYVQVAKPPISQPLIAGPKWSVAPCQASPHPPDRLAFGVDWNLSRHLAEGIIASTEYDPEERMPTPRISNTSLPGPEKALNDSPLQASIGATAPGSELLRSIKRSRSGPVDAGLKWIRSSRPSSFRRAYENLLEIAKAAALRNADSGKAQLEDVATASAQLGIPREKQLRRSAATPLEPGELCIRQEREKIAAVQQSTVQRVAPQSSLAAGAPVSGVLSKGARGETTAAAQVRRVLSTSGQLIRNAEHSDWQEANAPSSLSKHQVARDNDLDSFFARFSDASADHNPASRTQHLGSFSPSCRIARRNQDLTPCRQSFAPNTGNSPLSHSRTPHAPPAGNFLPASKGPSPDELIDLSVDGEGRGKRQRRSKVQLAEVFQDEDEEGEERGLGKRRLRLRRGDHDDEWQPDENEELYDAANLEDDFADDATEHEEEEEEEETQKAVGRRRRGVPSWNARYQMQPQREEGNEESPILDEDIGDSAKGSLFKRPRPTALMMVPQRIYDNRIHLPLYLVLEHFPTDEFPIKLFVKVTLNGQVVGSKVPASIVRYRKHKREGQWNFWLRGLMRVLRGCNDVRVSGVDWDASDGMIKADLVAAEQG